MEATMEPTRDDVLLPCEAGLAWRLARDIARAERRGADSLAESLERTRERLHALGLELEDAASSALLLFALGLRDRGLGHVAVVAALRPHGDAAARRAALESASIVRASRPDLEPERLAALRRRAAVTVFALFAAWGAAGAWILIGAAGR
jgi:hypothetical protein